MAYSFTYITKRGRELTWTSDSLDGEPKPQAIQDAIAEDNIPSMSAIPGVGDERETHEAAYDHAALVAANHTHANKTQLDAVTDGDHDIRTDNPHTVTKTQVGLAVVPNLDTTSAVNNDHTHSNKTELDLVSDGDHDVRTDNPHAVSKAQVGLTNVPDLNTTNAVNNEHTHSNKTELDLVTDGDHDVRTDNPHTVTKAQVGLTNVPDLDTTSAVNNDHTHSNKATLDTYTQTEVNLADAVSKKHTQNTDTKLDEGGANEIAASAIRPKAFTPTTSGDWTTSPTTVQAALDELAARVKALEP